MKERSVLLIYGASGLVGSRFVELLSSDYQIVSPSHQEVDVTNQKQVDQNVDQVGPDYILYMTAHTNVDLAEKESNLAHALNVEGPRNITSVAAERNIPFCYPSTDFVFDGTKSDSPYTEEDSPNPLSVYAKTKREGEVVTLGASPHNLVARLIMPYGAYYERKTDIGRAMLQRLKEGKEVTAVTDQNINPIFIDDLIYALDALIKNRSTGTYHLGAGSFTTPFNFAQQIAREFGFEDSLIKGVSFKDYPRKPDAAVRPQHSWLDVSKFNSKFPGKLHTIDEGIHLFKQQVVDLSEDFHV